jgi:predicted  nucleic acid-binding Zn-ribbon protein
VKDQLALLVQLQELDLQLNQQKGEQKNLPEKLKISEQPLVEARATVAEAKTTLESLTKERKEKEQALQAAEEKIVKLKGRLTELKTNKEYQAHLQEIESANTEKGKTEELLLMVMEKGDLLKKEVVAKEAALGAEEKVFSREKAEMDERLKQLSESARKLESEWAVLSEQVEKKLLEEYKRLAASRKGIAVAPLNGNICTGCHFSLPPQLIAEVKMGGKILNCTYCHRILYARPA